MAHVHIFSGVVTCIKIRANNLECVSASDDGTCIIWWVFVKTLKIKMLPGQILLRIIVLIMAEFEFILTILCRDLNRFVRNQIIFANTLFKAVCYQPAETQLLSGGSDRKVISANYS